MSRLYWKIFGFLSLTQFTAILIISSGVWFHQSQRTVNTTGVEISPPARTIIQSASATLKYGGKQALIALLEEWQQRKRMPQVLAINSNDQELLQRDYSPEALATAKALIAHKATLSVNAILLDDKETITLFVPDRGRHRLRDNIKHQNSDKAHLHVGSKLHQHKHSSHLPFWPITASLLVSLLFAAIIAWYFSKPIQLLQAAFAKGAKGDLDSDIAKSMGNRKDAFSDLGAHFDTMATRLGKLIKGQKRLLNQVSHELRSPLSRMQIAIGLAKQSPDKIPSALERIQLESERMDQLIGELLQLSRLESGVNEINRATVNLSDLIQDMLDDASFEAAEKSITVNGSITHDCMLSCDAALIYRAVENVIRNALKYTRAESSVYISLTTTPNQMIQITVTDQGDGVDEAALEDIFQPFFRINHAQPKHGYGIGLALAKQIIEAHNGSIYASNNTESTGLTVSILLPII